MIDHEWRELQFHVTFQVHPEVEKILFHSGAPLV